MTVTRLVDGGLFEVIRERYSKQYDAVTQKHNVYVRLHCLIDLEALFAVTLSYERVSHVRQAGYRQRRRHLLELLG
ncbi:MAG: hypothetical protein PVG70_11360 [Desulfobacterales bacterium]